MNKFISGQDKTLKVPSGIGQDKTPYTEVYGKYLSDYLSVIVRGEKRGFEVALFLPPAYETKDPVSL